MTNAPPTVPGPLSSPEQRLPRPLLGLLICGIPVALVCFTVPLAMGSNVWPIAGIIWFAFTVPIAVIVGAIGGLLLRRLKPTLFIAPLAMLSIVMAITAGYIIYNNP